MIRRLTLITLCVLVIAMRADAPSAQSQDPNEAAAMRALDAFLAGFNSRDARTFASALHFPHVQLEGGDVRYFATEEEYVALGKGLWASVQDDWDHTVWDDRRIVQKLPGTIHIAGRWARLNKEGKAIAKADVLYVVAQKSGRWAILCRSGSRSAQGAYRIP